MGLSFTPSFITIDEANMKIDINPTQNEQAGTYQLTITLTDPTFSGDNFSSYSILIKVNEVEETCFTV